MVTGEPKYMEKPPLPSKIYSSLRPSKMTTVTKASSAMKKIYCISLLWRCKSCQFWENQQWDTVIPCGYIKKSNAFCVGSHIILRWGPLPGYFHGCPVGHFIVLSFMNASRCFFFPRGRLSLSHVLPICLMICEMPHVYNIYVILLCHCVIFVVELNHYWRST